MACVFFCVFVCKQKTAYEMRISDWSSDVCSSDLHTVDVALLQAGVTRKDGTDDIVSLGTMFRQPVMIFYRASKPITLLSQLDGERIAVGHAGSGTQVLAMALLSANGIAEGGKTTFLELEGEAASAALLAHQADAVILSGDSASVKIFRDLVHADGIRLFDFTQGEAYERRFRYLNRFELPAGAFDLGENLPDHRKIGRAHV